MDGSRLGTVLIDGKLDGTIVCCKPSLGDSLDDGFNDWREEGTDDRVCDTLGPVLEKLGGKLSTVLLVKEGWLEAGNKGLKEDACVGGGVGVMAGRDTGGCIGAAVGLGDGFEVGSDVGLAVGLLVGRGVDCGAGKVVGFRVVTSFGVKLTVKGVGLGVPPDGTSGTPGLGEGEGISATRGPSDDCWLEGSAKVGKNNGLSATVGDFERLGATAGLVAGSVGGSGLAVLLDVKEG